MECTSCGATVDHRDAFCSKCGAFTDAGQPIGQKIGIAAAQAGTALTEFSKRAFAYARDEANRKQVIVGGAAAAILLLFATDNPLSSSISGMISDSDGPPAMTAEGLPNFDAYQDQFVSEEKEFIVSGTANVRNFPTSQETTITHTFAGGETVLAREVRAFDPSSQWYKLSSGGYIWGGNLLGVGQTQEAPDPVYEPGTSVFPSSLQGRWSDRRSCNEPAQNIIDVSGDSMTVNGEWYGLESEPSSMEWPIEFLVYYSGETDIHVTGITVHMSASGREIAVREAGDTGSLVWLSDEGLLGCS